MALIKKAYAKINLALDIVGRRNDGYHMVRMIMQTVGVHDTLTFEKRDDGKAEIAIRFFETDEGEGTKKPLSLGEDNLIYKAARILMDRGNITDSVDITLEKCIPIAAGLAGGSSDCAATLNGINELFQLGLTQEELMEIGVTLGADVPYCLLGGTAISEGIGEELTKLPEFPECTVLLAKPGIGVSTKEAYGGYDSLEDSGAAIAHPDMDRIISILKNEENKDAAVILSELSDKMGNVLEIVTAANHPEIGRIEQTIKETGADAVMMSGSGPTVVALFQNSENAWKAAELLSEREEAAEIFVTTIKNDILTD